MHCKEPFRAVVRETLRKCEKTLWRNGQEVMRNISDALESSVEAQCSGVIW